MRTGLLRLAVALTLIGGAAFAAETVALTEIQRDLIEQDASGRPAQVAPSNFVPFVGARIPNQLRLRPLSDQVMNQIPSVKGYQYTKIQNNRILLVDPGKREVVAIIG